MHKKNWIIADRLFSAIAGELQTESIDARHMKEKLIVEAIIDMDFPLSMKSGTKHDAAEVITAAKERDCPEYMLFQLYAGGNCDLKKVALVLEFIALELV